MKAPFVRFSRFLRSPLLWATFSLSLLWGCRHLPSSRCANECPATATSGVTADAPVHHTYKEPATANVIPRDAVEPPIVSLSEDDVFLPVLDRPADSAPTATPAPVVRKELEPDDVPSSAVAPTPKLEVPPEPAPKAAPTPTEIAEPPAAAAPQKAPPASTTAGDHVPLPKIEPAKPAREQTRRLENEVFSLESYCDGLVFDAQGFGYVSHKNQIVRFSPTGDSQVWATLGSPKGHRIEPEGTHLVCDLERRAVLRLSFEGKVVGVAAKDCDGAPFRAPFDVAVDSQGGFYFTDPGYVQMQQPVGKVHYVDRRGNVSVVAAKIGYPTGIVYDQIRQRLLVAESQFNRVLEFRLAEPGRVASHEVLVQLPVSAENEYHLASLCLDAEGNLYVTEQATKSVQVFDTVGRPLGRFSTNSVVPSSLAFRSPQGSGELLVGGGLDAPSRAGRVIRLNLGQ
jgi:gluconolactonase